MSRPHYSHLSSYMQRRGKWLATGLLIIAVLCSLLLIVFAWTAPVVETTVMADGGAQQTLAYFPHVLPSGKKAEYVLSIERGQWSQLWMHATPDECIDALQVNETSVPIPEADRCSYPDGIEVNLAPFMKQGNNTLTLNVRNEGGPMGLDVELNPWHSRTMHACKALALASFFVLIGIACGLHRRVGIPVTMLLYASLILSGTQYFSSHYLYYSHDIIGHLDYIKTIAGDHKLPDPTGWQSQQPPLYYLTAAALFMAGKTFGMADPMFAARLLSPALYAGFLVVLLLTIEHYCKRSPWQIMASSLILFWPEGFTFPGRISNDMPILLLSSLVLYFLVLWNSDRQQRHLKAALCLALVALAVKGSAIIALGAVGIMSLLALYRREIRLRAFFSRPVISCFLIGVILNFGRTLQYRIASGRDIKWLANADLNTLQPWLLSNTPYDYLYFDVNTFLAYPYFFTGPTQKLFWNGFLKSLLMGEWYWRSPTLALLLSGVFLIVLLYAVSYIFLQTKSTIRRYLPLLVMTLCMIGALMMVRMSVPIIGQVNARYIFGIIVIVAIFFTHAVQLAFQRERVVIAWTGVATAALFCLLSIAFILGEYPQPHLI